MYGLRQGHNYIGPYLDVRQIGDKQVMYGLRQKEIRWPDFLALMRKGDKTGAMTMRAITIYTMTI